MAGDKKSKYAAELARLKALNAIKEVLKKSDIENAALTNTSKDSETVSDNALDNMLNELNLDKNSSKDLEIIESLSLQNRNSDMLKRKGVPVRAKVKVVKKVAIVKRKPIAAKRPKLKGKSARKKR